MPLCQDLFRLRLPRLEGIPQSELDEPRRSHRTGDLSEIAPFHVSESRIGEVCVIPNVKEIGSESQLLPLGNLEVLDQREVPVLLTRPSEGVASQVSEAGSAEIGIVYRIALGRVEKRRRCERAEIQIAVDPCADTSAGLSARNRCPWRQTRRQHAWSGSRSQKPCASSGIQDREWRTGLNDGDATHRPSRQQLVSQAFRGLEEWQIVAITHGQPVRAVEIRQPARIIQCGFVVEGGIEGSIAR